MKLVFISNLINHHQVPVADKMAALQGVQYYFIATEPIPEFLLRGGYSDYSDRSYLINAYENEEKRIFAKKLIDEAEVLIHGSIPGELVAKRILDGKLTFCYSERLFKTGYKSLFSPRAWKNYYKLFTRFRNYNYFMLCASAYTKPDVQKIFAFPGKCYKWGYFTKVEDIDIEKIISSKRGSKIKLLFVGRFLKWKHTDLSILLAERLRNEGVDFEINIFGSGEKEKSLKELIDSLDLSDYVKLQGNRKNEEILKQMQEHHILLFLSDRNEGWGAVVNEAMSNGCVVVGNKEAGSVPMLIKDGYNGMIYSGHKVESIYEKVKFLIDNMEEREQMAKNAYRTMKKVWSPENAVVNFQELVKSILHHAPNPISEGPGSFAE